ncbi:hypothetical protein VaNZ11_007345 [Volvox africanus]|uniref:Ribosome biogenesis protein NOP53 n=1 Tax=Volvox africanus TaxID=51714 RepID=A0ABQ5S3L0_9CHLO|nr:hypothetical protein VaNZ11_007345 [Volvox africanus]
MSKGISQRRRLKRALEAARGNMHKIANGKALPTELPEAPKPTDTEKLPASLRKMLALKEVAAQKNRQNKKEGLQRLGPPDATGSKGKKAKLNDGANGGPSPSGRDVTGGTQQQQQQQQQQPKGGDRAVAKGANHFTELFAQKKLKAKKKEYLKRKAEMKHKRGAKSQVVVEKELQLKDNIKFGEVVDAPLKVNLKRKHWVEKERTANERCKEVFLMQMKQAKRRLGAGEAIEDEGITVRDRDSGGGRRSAKGANSRSGAAPNNHKRKPPMDAATEELRQQVIESYRAARKSGGFHNVVVGNATMASLSHLVGKDGGTKSVSTGSGKTHTLA